MTENIWKGSARMLAERTGLNAKATANLRDSLVAAGEMAKAEKVEALRQAQLSLQQEFALLFPEEPALAAGE